MQNFTTRVEIQNPDEGDYDLLDLVMLDALFCKAIKHDGTWWDLPTAEYDCLSALTTTYIYNLAFTAAKTVIDNKPINDMLLVKDFLIIVTKSDGDRVFNLVKTTDISNLPKGETL